MEQARRDDFSQLSWEIDRIQSSGTEDMKTSNGVGDGFLFLFTLFSYDGVRSSVGVPGVVSLIKLDNPI